MAHFALVHETASGRELWINLEQVRFLQGGTEGCMIYFGGELSMTVAETPKQILVQLPQEVR